MLVCCGLATLDVVQTIERLPSANEKIVARGLSATFGGPAANAAATAVALGVPVRLVTILGTGPLAEVVRSEVAAAGVELVEAAQPDGASPAVSTVLVTESTGERAVISTNASGLGSVAGMFDGVGTGGMDALLASLLGPTDDSADGSPHVLLLDGHHPELALALARHAHERGMLVVLDGGSYKPGTADLVRWCDVVVLSEDFRWPDVPVEGLLDVVAGLGPAFVARSRGALPIEVLEAGERYAIEVPVAAAVVDTLGAGDVLHGALAAGLSRGETVRAALTSAARTATFSVGHPGARGWFEAFSG